RGHVDCSGFVFFFQAEDGIRDFHVTGVQTCALPILATALGQALGAKLQPAARVPRRLPAGRWRAYAGDLAGAFATLTPVAVRLEIGRASCRERGGKWGVGGAEEEKAAEGRQGDEPGR